MKAKGEAKAVTKKKKELKYFSLSNKEEEAMKVLWNSDKALSAMEIAEGIPDRSWPSSSIQNIMRSLEKKGAIVVDSVIKLGKSYGRVFRPALSANEYASMQFERFYQGRDRNCFSVLSSFLGNTKSSKEEIIDALEKLLEQYREDDI